VTPKVVLDLVAIRPRLLNLPGPFSCHCKAVSFRSSVCLLDAGRTLGFIQGGCVTSHGRIAGSRRPVTLRTTPEMSGFFCFAAMYVALGEFRKGNFNICRLFDAWLIRH
jgi:hypothetical protein